MVTGPFCEILSKPCTFANEHNIKQKFFVLYFTYPTSIILCFTAMIMSPLQNTRMSDKKIKKKNIRQSDLVPLHIVNFTHTTHPLKCSIMNTSLRYRVIYCNNLTSHPCEQSIHGNCPYHRCAWHSKLHWMLPVLVYHSVISCAPGLCRSITTNIIGYLLINNGHVRIIATYLVFYMHLV